MLTVTMPGKHNQNYTSLSPRPVLGIAGNSAEQRITFSLLSSCLPPCFSPCLCGDLGLSLWVFLSWFPGLASSGGYKTSSPLPPHCSFRELPGRGAHLVGGGVVGGGSLEETGKALRPSLAPASFSLRGTQKLIMVCHVARAIGEDPSFL